jgi:hypothetical protein
MEKITPAVIIALVIGVVAGYLLRGILFPTSESEPIETAVSNQSPQAMAQPGSKEAKIEEAMGAAPETVAKNATIFDYPESATAQPVELQKGTNDWSCFPDYPGSPGKDPMCVDKQGMVWLQAYTSQQSPSLAQAGLAYMLAGGSDASNTDPFATGPAEGNDWVTSPAHTMVFPVGKLDQSVYSTDPKNGGPWIMWAGTPYEHLMVPVK